MHSDWSGETARTRSEEERMWQQAKRASMGSKQEQPPSPAPEPEPEQLLSAPYGSDFAAGAAQGGNGVDVEYNRQLEEAIRLSLTGAPPAPATTARAALRRTSTTNRKIDHLRKTHEAFLREGQKQFAELVAEEITQLESIADEDESFDVYAFLGVEALASDPEIRDAYITRASELRYSPRPEDAAQLEKLSACFVFISDPFMRMQYDAGDHELDPDSAAAGAAASAGAPQWALEVYDAVYRRVTDQIKDDELRAAVSTSLQVATSGSEDAVKQHALVLATSHDGVFAADDDLERLHTKIKDRRATAALFRKENLPGMAQSADNEEAEIVLLEQRIVAVTQAAAALAAEYERVEAERRVTARQVLQRRMEEREATVALLKSGQFGPQDTRVIDAEVEQIRQQLTALTNGVAVATAPLSGPTLDGWLLDNSPDGKTADVEGTNAWWQPYPASVSARLTRALMDCEDTQKFEVDLDDGERYVDLARTDDPGVFWQRRHDDRNRKRRVKFVEPAAVAAAAAAAAEAVPPPVWEWEDDTGQWQPYDVPVRLQLEHAVQAGQKRVDLSGRAAGRHVDLTNFPASIYQRVSDAPQRRRRVRRGGAGGTEAQPITVPMARAASTGTPSARPAWQWLGDSAWMDYPPEACKRLDTALANDAPICRIDGERHVELTAADGTGTVMSIEEDTGQCVRYFLQRVTAHPERTRQVRQLGGEATIEPCWARLSAHDQAKLTRFGWSRETWESDRLPEQTPLERDQFGWLTVGDHVFYRGAFNSLFCHEAVFIGNDTVIEFGGGGGFRADVKDNFTNVKLRPKDLPAFQASALKKKIGKLKVATTKKKRVVHARTYRPGEAVSAREAIRRAKSRVGGGVDASLWPKYNPVTNNCQTFANWCKAGGGDTVCSHLFNLLEDACWMLSLVSLRRLEARFVLQLCQGGLRAYGYTLQVDPTSVDTTQAVKEVVKAAVYGALSAGASHWHIKLQVMHVLSVYALPACIKSALAAVATAVAATPVGGAVVAAGAAAGKFAVAAAAAHPVGLAIGGATLLVAARWQWRKRQNTRAKHRTHWQQDEDAMRCNGASCRLEFTLTRRRHHCRECGLLFCDDCSAHKKRLPSLGMAAQERVCASCFEGKGPHPAG